MHSSGSCEPVISIAMATFEGRAFLEMQFESIIKQTRHPNEVIIYDDASSDDTVSVLKTLKARAPFSVKIIKGTKNLGVNHAFGVALAACRGDYIFFCDQDDLWEPEKIESFMAVFERNPAVGLVFCDASQIDAEGKFLNRSLWQQIGFNARRNRRFKRDPVAELLRGGNFIYGMAAAFRTESLRPFLPINADPRGITHDTWFALHVLSVGWSGWALDRKLVQYRRHGRQATSQHASSNNDSKQSRLASREFQMISLITGLERVRDGVSSASFVRSEKARISALYNLACKIQHLKSRELLRKTRDPILALRASISPCYWKYAKGPYSAARDFFGF